MSDSQTGENPPRRPDADDRVSLAVADDPTDGTPVVTGLTVSLSEKVSTGDYENMEPFVSRDITLTPAVPLDEPAGRAHVRTVAMEALADAQRDLSAVIDARLSAGPQFEDWPDSVAPDVLGQDADGSADD